MKKLIYTSIAILFAGSAAIAQKSLVPNDAPKHAWDPSSVEFKPTQSNKLGKADISDWYDPNDWLLKATAGGSTLTNFVTFAMPDSLAQYVNSGDSVQRFYNIAFGQVIDPKDPYIAGSDNPGIQMSKFSSYTLDSFYLQYLYVRNVDSAIHPVSNIYDKVVDTLVVYYMISGNGLTTGGVFGTGATAGRSQEASWDRTTLRPTTYVAMEKFTLTDADSTIANNSNGGFENGWLTKPMIKKVGPTVSVPAGDNNYLGIVYKFIPGMSYNDSSIMVYQRDPATFPAGRKRVNYFGTRYSSNSAPAESQWRSQTFFTHSLFSYPRNAYYAANQAINNNWDNFIPGSAYFEGQLIYSAMFVNAQKVGVKENDVVAITSLYPNPTKDQTTIALNLKQAGVVKVSVLNLIGQEVTSVNAGNLGTGSQNVTLNLSALNPGVYFVNVNVNGQSTTQKITVTK